MAQEVVTQLVIDADTRGADDFSRAMDGAEQAANRGLGTILGVNTSIAGLGLGAAGAVAGLNTLMNYVVGANKDLADLDRAAKAAGLSLAQIQGIKFGANASGLSDSDFFSGLQKSAALLNDARRNINSLTKLFDANGDSIRNANGQLLTENQLLQRAAEYMRNAATEQDKIKIAEMLGLTREWVPYLGQGADAMNSLADEARQAGAVIDDETIEKATQFDKEWRKSTVTLEANLKAAFSNVLPIIDDLIDRASRLLTVANAKKVAEHGQQALRDAGIPESSELKIDVTPEGWQAIKDFREASSIWSGLWGLFPKLSSMISVSAVSSPLPYSGRQPIPDEYDNVNLDLLKRGDAHQRALDAAQDAAQDAADRITKVPASQSGASDAFDRATQSIERHTARTIADTQAVGLGVDALAELRAQAQLMTAAQQAGIPITTRLSDKVQDLAQDAGDAALALQKAKTAYSISFGRQTGLLSQDDVQIAQQLKQLYPDVATALGSVEAQGLRLNTAMRGLSSSLESNLVSGLTDITTGSKSASQGFQDMSKAIVRAIEEMIIKITIITPLMRALQGAFGSFGFGSLLGGASSTLGLDGLAAVHHAGGVVGDGTDARYVHPAYFDFAPRYHSGGIAGLAPDEVPAILQRGERVIPRGESGRNGVAVNVQVINETGVQARTETTQAPNGDVTVHLKKMVEAIGVESIASGEMGRTITSKYGVKQFMGQ